jgi:hypothetical protein
MNLHLLRKINFYVLVNFIFDIVLLLNLFIHSSMSLQPFVEPWPLFPFRNPIHSL